MDLVVNDYSLDGQFTSVEDFLDSLVEYTIPLLKIISATGMELYKSHNTYCRSVTKDKRLEHIIRDLKGVAEITVLRQYLVQLYCDEPFWNDSSKSSVQVKYKNIGDDYPNCLSETYARSGVLMSFKNDNFLADDIYGNSNNKNVVINNAFNSNQFLKHYFNLTKDVIYYLSNATLSIPVLFKTVNTRCYGMEIINSKDLTDEDRITIRDDIICMVDATLGGKVTRFSRDLGRSLYEFRTTISSGREFRLFYHYKSGNVEFLNGCIKKSKKASTTEIEIARRLMSL